MGVLLVGEAAPNRTAEQIVPARRADTPYTGHEAAVDPRPPGITLPAH